MTPPDKNISDKISVLIRVKSAVIRSATNQRSNQRYISAITFLLAVAFLFSPVKVSAVTEFISIVDTGPSGDYSTLSAWEQYNQTDLTSAATQVFSGTRTNNIADSGITVYLCRGGVYQSHSGTVVHATTSQILIETITGSAIEQANDIWYTNDTCDSANYFTISDGGDSAISVASCQATTGAADQTAVKIEGWDTSAANYIKIYTTQTNRHDGVWDEGKYRIVDSEKWYPIIEIQEENVRIEGLQVHNNYSGGDGSPHGIEVAITAAGEFHFYNNIVRGESNSSASGIRDNGVEAGIIYYLKNNLVYDFRQCIFLRSGSATAWSAYIYNNTLIPIDATNQEGIQIARPDNELRLKNNLVQGSTTVNYNFNHIGGNCTTEYVDNLSEDTTSPNDEHDSKAVTFVNEGSDDFHLDSTDTNAKDQGTNLSSDNDLPFSDDIDSETRTNHSWDIGADEAAEAIYRSVGPSASSYLERGIDGGGNNLNISGSTATFASDLGTDVGVGDVIQYDDDNDGDIDVNDSVAFIHARASATSFTVKNSTGGAPTATLAADQDWYIFRSYDSLSHAESGDENASVNSALRDFDTWSNGKDIVTSNEQWNIACYNGEGDAADQTAVTINDWTTGENNYIKVYTPTEETEVGTTQRHSGVWNTGKYRLEVAAGAALIVWEDYVTVEGLQVKARKTTNGDTCIEGDTAGTGVHHYGYNILQGGKTAINFGSGGTSPDTYWYNNIIYDYSDKCTLNYSNNYVYNCVFKSDNTSTIGLRNYQGTLTVINSAVFNNGDDFSLNAPGTSTITYCASDDGDGSDSVQPADWTAVFEDHANGDFHLKSTDTDLKDAGTSDPGLGLFSDDIDGDSRPSPYWDIGADEYPAKQKAKFKGEFKFKGEITIR